MAKPVWRPTDKTEDNVHKIIQALQNGLSRTSACAVSNIPRSTFYTWLEQDEDFRTKVEDAEEYWLWLVEKMKMELIKEKHRPAIEKELKSKRREVYWDKQEIEQRNINTEVPLEQMSDEDLLKYVKQQ